MHTEQLRDEQQRRTDKAIHSKCERNMCKCTLDNLHLVHIASANDSCLVIELCTSVFALSLYLKAFC